VALDIGRHHRRFEINDVSKIRGSEVAACLEIVVGITLILVPGFACQLLFGAPLTGDGVPITRFAGIGLLSLGIAY
jgi:hypothetical protein